MRMPSRGPDASRNSGRKEARSPRPCAPCGGGEGGGGEGGACGGGGGPRTVAIALKRRGKRSASVFSALLAYSMMATAAWASGRSERVHG